jgi:hypothetical protein
MQARRIRGPCAAPIARRQRDALAMSGKMEPGVSMTGFDRVERRRDKIDLARGPAAWRTRPRSRTCRAGPDIDTAFADCATTARFGLASWPGSA